MITVIAANMVGAAPIISSAIAANVFTIALPIVGRTLIIYSSTLVNAIAIADITPPIDIPTPARDTPRAVIPAATAVNPNPTTNTDADIIPKAAAIVSSTPLTGASAHAAATNTPRAAARLISTPTILPPSTISPMSSSACANTTKPTAATVSAAEPISVPFIAVRAVARI